MLYYRAFCFTVGVVSQGLYIRIKRSGCRGASNRFTLSRIYIYDNKVKWLYSQ